MIKYLDTSLLVPLYTAEAASDSVAAWFDRHHGEEFAISDWVLTEFESAIGLKVRSQKLPKGDALRAIARFDAERAAYLNLAFDTRIFAEARLLLRTYEAGLRASDALHLAIAVGRNAELCTRDRKFHLAAGILGLPSQLV